MKNFKADVVYVRGWICLITRLDIRRILNLFFPFTVNTIYKLLTVLQQKI